jgi:hypothetical protein
MMWEMKGEKRAKQWLGWMVQSVVKARKSVANR